MTKKIIMAPDYGDAVFWDEEGCCIGGFEALYVDGGETETEIDISCIDGLQGWYSEWSAESLYNTNHWTDNQWRDWWGRGLALAQRVRALLPANVELYYFTLQDPIWSVKPEGSLDGGVFNHGIPMKI